MDAIRLYYYIIDFLNISIVYRTNIQTLVLNNAATQTKYIYVSYIILRS